MKRLWPVGILLLLVVGYFVWRRPAPAAPAAPDEEAAAAPPVSQPLESAEPAAPRIRPPSFGEERLRKALDDYKRVAAYPVWSRVHDEGTRYLLEWNQPIVDELPMSDRAGEETVYVFGADRTHVTYGEPLTSWIEVHRKGDKSARLPITVESANVMILGGPHPGRAAPLTYHDDGQDGDQVAGDLVYSNRFIPSQIDALKQAEQVRIVAAVKAGDLEKPLLRDFTYSPRPVVTLDGVSDSIKQGSLAITLDVEVAEKGLYTFLGNVMSGDGKIAIAYAEKSLPLEAGRTQVDLVFFGKAFYDKAQDGPYLVRDLRGFERFLDGSEASIWWSDPRLYQTRPYPRSQFSSAEWNGAEKQQKIQAFERLIAGSGQSGPAPSR